MFYRFSPQVMTLSHIYANFSTKKYLFILLDYTQPNKKKITERHYLLQITTL